ncbi:proline dehydrogenase [bacterium]|nr:proline dehydrogenase [bacterium]
MSLFDSLVVAGMPFVPKKLVRHFADPYIAGESLQDAIDTVQRLNRQGICATIDVLGEGITRKEQATRAVDRYIQVVEAIEREKLDANISIKPTQFGLGIDPAFCRDNYRRVIEVVKPYDNFIRIDMEDSPFTTLTLDLYEDLVKEYPRIGVVVQAYLRRTLHDIESRLAPVKANIRLCKGIYIEPHEIAYRDFDIVRKNYILLLRKALEAGMYVGIATHDEMLVWEAYRLIDEMGVEKDQYEFQMLLGVTESLRRQIVQDGHKMRVYVPFGQDWYPYSTRRLKENPKIAGYVAKDILGISRK